MTLLIIIIILLLFFKLLLLLLLLLKNVCIILDSQKRKTDEASKQVPKKRKQTVSRYTNLEEAKKKKTSVVPIRNTDNELCCASAITLAVERYKELNLKVKPNDYKKYLQANRTSRPSNIPLFTAAAKKLHVDAGKCPIFILYPI